MPKVAAVATAVPPHPIDQAEAMGLARSHFSQGFADLDRLLPLFTHTGVKQRFLARPPRWYLDDHSFEESNHIFIEVATELSSAASQAAMHRARVTPDQIDYLLLVNSTGLATPSIDARLMNRLGLPTHTRRTPIWGLGCAGGTAGLAHAHHHALGHPRSRTLLVAVELCSLTFLADDYGKSNLVAAALFSDGAAAALIIGDQVEGPGYTVLDTRSTFYPDSLDIMGWNVRSRGLQVVFSRRIPQVVRANASEELSSFLQANDLDQDSVSLFLHHPGGRKVLEAYAAAYGADPDQFRFSAETLAEYGNMSSATVLFVLERCLREHGLGRGEYAVASALGPGFCSESLLLRAT